MHMDMTVTINSLFVKHFPFLHLFFRSVYWAGFQCTFKLDH